MASLKEKSESILNEKQLNLLPENIKKDITVLGVTGTYEGSAGVKLFETIENMNNDETAKEGDLAIVYRNEIQNMKADTQTQYITFPETVTLPEAFTSSSYLRLRAVDMSIMFDGNIQLNQTSFRFDGFSESGMIRISYSSDDGITYTRDEFMGESDNLTNPVDLGTLIQVETEMGEWNDSFGYFMQIGGNIFEGLFNYKLGVFNYSACLLSELTVLDNELHRGATYILVNKDEIDTAISNAISYMKSEMNMTFSGGDAGTVLMKDADTLVFIFGADSTIPSSGRRLELTIDTNTNTVTGLCTTDSYNGCMLVEFDIHTGSYITHTFDTLETTLSGNKATNKYNHYYLLSYYNSDSKKLQPDMYCMIGASTGNRYGNVYEYESLEYVFADTQLNALSENVYNSIAYGKNGIIDGNITKTVSNSFADINAEIYGKVQQAYDNMEPRVLTDDDKDIDENICSIPLKSDGTLLLDTTQVTDMSYLFKNCKNLLSVPLINTSNATNMVYMFWNCTNLVTVSLIDTSHITDMLRMFQGCSSLVNVPLLDMSNATSVYGVFNGCTSLITVPEFNTQNAETFTDMFSGCTSLQEIPIYNTSSATSLSDMFSRCPNLSDDSLNNILTMCISATNISSKNKTLEYVGLSEEQAQKCTTLSNYQSFTEAGWTTGY